jgi:transposase
MTEHCAQTCSIITEAVKLATTESRIAMALVAIKEEKISEREAASRFGVPRTTLQRKAATGSTGPNGPVEDLRPTPTKGKDGKLRKPPAKPEEKARAWEMQDAGMTKTAIAKELNRGDGTVHRWLAGDREQSTLVPAEKQKQSFILEKPAAIALEQSKEQLTPTGELSHLTKELIKKESKAFNERTALLEQSVRLRNQLDALWKYAQKKHDKSGRSVLRQDMEIASKSMVQDRTMTSMALALGLEETASYFEIMLAIDQLGKDISLYARQTIFLFGHSARMLS